MEKQASCGESTVSEGTEAAQSLLDILPVEISQNILSYLDNSVICANLVSLTSKSWKKKAFTLLKELHTDLLDAWRLRDAPFDFQRIESVILCPNHRNYDALIKKFPVRRPGEREKSDISTKIDVAFLSAVVDWAPKFGARLWRLELHGTDDARSTLSSRLLSSVSSAAANSIQEMTLTCANDAMFSSAMRFPNVTHLRLYRLRIRASVDPAVFIASLASIFPNVSYLLLHLHQVDGAPRADRPAWFAQLKLFGKLQTLAFGDPVLDYAMSYPHGPELKWFIDEAVANIPSTIELRVVQVGSRRPWQAETLPNFAWILGWSLDKVEEMEAKFPATPERPRPTYAFINRILYISETHHPFNEEVQQSLDLWCRLPNTGSFASVSDRGESVLSAGLRIFNPVVYIKTIVKRTFNDIQKTQTNFDDDSKVWSQLSPVEKSDDRAVLLASMSKIHGHCADVLEYVTSDEFPAVLRTFLNKTTTIEPKQLRHGPIVTCLENYNILGILTLLRAGVPPVVFAFKEGNFIIQNTAVLEHPLNLQLLELLWPASKPYMTPELLSASIYEMLRIAGGSWERSAPNLPQVVQFFLDKGASVLLSKTSMMYAARCSSSLSADLFRQFAQANKNHLSKDEWTSILLDVLGAWDTESSVEYLEILCEMGADPSIGLSHLFNVGWHTRLEIVLELTRLLLKHGADPRAKDGDGYEVIQRFAVFCPGGRVTTALTDSTRMQALVDLFSSKVVLIPEPSQEVCKHIQDLEQAAARARAAYESYED